MDNTIIKRYINQDPQILVMYSKRSLFRYIQQNYRFNNNNKKDIKEIYIPFKKPRIYNKISYKNNRKLGYEYLIHGSQADNTYTRFSDIDDIIILKENFFEDYNVFCDSIDELHRLNYIYQNHDITQHHGHWIFTYDELLNYDESIMPLSVFKEAISIYGDTEINYCLSKNSNFKKIFDITAKNILKNINLLYDNNINLYFLKILVSSISLIFPLYFQCKGENITKKEAIERAQDYFEKDILDVLRWSTFIRKKWHKVYSYEAMEKFKYFHRIVKNRNITERIVSNYPFYIPASKLNVQEYFLKEKAELMLQELRRTI